MSEDAMMTAKVDLPMAAMESIWAVEPTRMGSLLRSMDSATLEIAMRSGNPAGAAAVMEIIDGVAVIEIVGLTNKRWSLPGWMVNTLDVQAAIEAALADDAVSAILLRIDSPGGSADGLAELGDVIFAARKQKSVSAQITGMGASAAYYLASQASAIYAQRMDLIGSIGVRMLIYDWHAWFAIAGVKAIPIDTGTYKSAGALGTELTEEQRDYFQTIVDGFFADFIDAVARGRGISEQKVMESADGRVFSATDAMARGLIDGIRTYEDTLAGLSGENTNRVGRGIAAAKENEVMGDEKAQATETPEAATAKTRATAAKSGATIAELKAALPDSDAAFREECMEAAMPIEAAKDRWMDRLRADNAAKTKQVEALKATDDAVGVAGVGVATNTAKDAAAGGDVIEEFEGAFKTRLDGGMPRAAAMRATVREDKERHEAYIEAYNERAVMRGRR